jgi:uncharacterized RDD family membrane protein YckC
MTQQPAGWYDDPEDPSQLRYWDGVLWSSHVSPKVSPSVAQSTIGMPYGVIPASARPQSLGSQGAQGAPTVQDRHGPSQRGQGRPGGRWPASGQGPGREPGWQSHPVTTPDGVVLSGWWKRVLARILDGIIVGIVALPLTYVPMKRVADVLGKYVQAVMTATQAGSATMPAQPTAELTGPILQASLISLALYMVYEITFLTWTGATIGKKVVGISVRLRDKPGPPPLLTVLKRTAVQESGSLFGSVPVLGTLASIFGLLDVLWPLWDDKKQAIHDKVAATNVVVGPQPRRDT